ncbi:MAG: MBL fold metallo-hydrolase [Streptosporangiaceae bacterium]
MTCRFPVGRLECAVVSDGQTEPPPEPALPAFFTTGSGVPDEELAAAIAAEGGHRTTLTCGCNCLLIRNPDGAAVIGTGLGPHFPGYGPDVGPLVGKLHSRLAEAGSPPPGLAAVAFTHLHQDHCRGAGRAGKPAFPQALGLAHAAEIAFWSARTRLEHALGPRSPGGRAQPPQAPRSSRPGESARARVPAALSWPRQDPAPAWRVRVEAAGAGSLSLSLRALNGRLPASIARTYASASS